MLTLLTFQFVGRLVKASGPACALALFFSLGLFSGCRGLVEPSSNARRDQAPAQSATPTPPLSTKPACPPTQSVYRQRCALCHGHRGAGNGVAAVNLRPGPPDLRAAAWQKQASDQAISDIIVYGSHGVGRSLMMPPHPDLAYCPKALDELVRTVRGFSGKSAR